jgi:serine/threonine protein kinase
VFLSYCHDDHKEVAQLRGDLIDNGLSVWWDKDILPAQDWKQEIRKAIRRCSAFILCLSENMDARVRSGSFPELYDAISQFRELHPSASSLIFPVRLSQCEIPDVEIDATRTLDRIQFVDLFPATKRADGLRRLLGGLGAALGPGHPGNAYGKSGMPDDELHALEKQLQSLELRGASRRDIEAIHRLIALQREARRKGLALSADDVLSARYVLASTLGTGGFGTVWKAYDNIARRVVAVKVLHPHLRYDRTPEDRFFRGARQMQKLTHQNIVRVLSERGEDRSYCYFVMEFLSGGDLRSAVLQGRLSREQQLGLLYQIGQALEFAHNQGVIHRDVKPANVLLDEGKVAKLTDFDLVRASDTAGFTRTGAIGTFLYASPEALLNGKLVDRRSDVYSFGMTTMFAIHGQDLPMNAIRETARFIDSLDCPDPVKAVLEKAVNAQPSDRYATIGDFMADLREAYGSNLSVGMRGTDRSHLGRYARRDLKRALVGDMDLIRRILAQPTIFDEPHRTFALKDVDRIVHSIAATLSRIQAFLDGENVLERIHFADLIDVAVQPVKPEMFKQGVRFAVDTPATDALPVVECDVLLVQIAISGLLHRAVAEATQEHDRADTGLVSLDVSVQDAPAGGPMGDGLVSSVVGCFAIGDNGRAMGDRDLAALRGNVVHLYTVSQEGGAGTALVTALHAVRELGGNVQHDRLDGTTLLRLVIPFKVVNDAIGDGI